MRSVLKESEKPAYEHGLFWQDEYYSCPGALADWIGDHLDPRERPQWPVIVELAKPCPLKVNYKDQAQHITEWLVEDYLNQLDHSDWHMICSGEAIVEGWLEDYYIDCDWYNGPSKEDCQVIAQAEQIMQAAIDWWLFWNAGLIRASKLVRHRPWRWSIGTTIIEQATEKAEKILKNIEEYVVPSRETISVSWPYKGLPYS